MSIDSDTRERLLSLLSRVYAPDTASELLERLVEMGRQFQPPRGLPGGWDEKDVLLISYGGQVVDGTRPALQVLKEFLVSEGLPDLLSTLHILPFYPWSSDDGFSVVDYRAVDNQLGEWEDVAALRDSLHLMFDLVLNHCSSRSAWFQQYLQGRLPGLEFFIEADPGADFSQVVRPRGTPLLSPVETSRGRRHVWTTFSEDQIDFDFSRPQVLLEMLSVLLFYIQQGARIIRLDAVAFLWKEMGTSCLNLPQTHALVKLMRSLVDALAPGVLLITETNLPHEQNLSYFGEGDEAHMIYQFSLPPLILDAFINQDARPLIEWTGGLEDPPAGSAFLNFTASHDGIGVRPLEGLVRPERLDALVKAAQARGGLVSLRRGPDGREIPYELNLTYRDALRDPSLSPELEVRRFLSSQALMLAMKGMPAVYFHSLTGTPNDLEGYRRAGIKRRINRHTYRLEELRRVVSQPEPQRTIYRGYRRLLATRRRQPAFHPDAGQRLWPFSRGSLYGVERMAYAASQRVLCLVNFSSRVQVLKACGLGGDYRRELISGKEVGAQVRLEPCQTLWLEELQP
ncbi:MAG TPA: sugar phosphorylase [Acidobacteriota bacterium]|nr:sugar phosphorylase [Acidobacteriota bacterium]